MRYAEFRLDEGYKEVTQKFAQQADLDEVKQAIEQFRDLVNRNQVQGNERNIDWWGKQGWDRFQKFVSAKSQQRSQTQQKARRETGRSHTIAENDEWLIVVPLDKDASCFHGKDTDWCTTKPTQEYFEKYFRDNSITLIYFLQKQTGDKWAMAVYEDGEAEYFDREDNELSQSDFDRQTGIDSSRYIDRVLDSEIKTKTDSSRSEMRSQVAELNNLLNQFEQEQDESLIPAIETGLMRTKDTNALKRFLRELASQGDNPFDNSPFELSQNLQNLAAIQAPSYLPYVSNITEKTKRMAIKNDLKTIQYIPNPSLEIIKYVESKDSHMLYQVVDPSPEVVEYMAAKNPFVIFDQRPSQVTSKAFQAATRTHLEDEGINKAYRNLLEWLKHVEDVDFGSKIDEEFYEWLVDEWSGENQKQIISAVVHHIFLRRRMARFKDWARKNLLPKYDFARELLSDFGIKEP